MESAKLASQPSHRRVAVAATMLVACLLLAAVPAAHAQESGVVYEPGSPSDKEYAIPLEQARRDAGGELPGRVEARAFGIGLSRIAPPRRKDGGGSGARSGAVERGSSSARRGGGATVDAGRRGGPEVRDLRARLADAEDVGAPAIWRLGPLLLALLPALIVALVMVSLRKRQQPVT